MTELLTVRDLMGIFKCSRSKLYRIIKTDGFPSPIGVGHPRWRAEDIAGWVASR